MDERVKRYTSGGWLIPGTSQRVAPNASHADVASNDPAAELAEAMRAYGERQATASHNPEQKDNDHE